MLPAQTPTSQPPPTAIDPAAADKLLALFLADQTATLAEIAGRADLPLRTVTAILESDEARQTLSLIKRLAADRAEIIALEVRVQAIFATRRIALQATNHETARRAAASLLNLSFMASSHSPKEEATAQVQDTPVAIQPPDPNQHSSVASAPCLLYTSPSPRD